MTFGIPVIIFSMAIINIDDNFDSLFNILIGILLIIFAINPWASGAFLRLAIENN